MNQSKPASGKSSSPLAQSEQEATKKKRGFAAMDRDQVRELARLGGTAAHRAGTAHKFSRDEARAAGRKGGIAAHAADRARPTEGDVLDAS